MTDHETLSFLTGKSTPGLLPDVYAPRHKLLQKLTGAAAQTRFVYIGAPAGSGKTLSVLLWLNSCGRRAVWLGVDNYDNILPVFYKQLATGFFSLQPDNSAMEAVLVDPGFSASPVTHTVRLISEMRPDPEPCALVLDDLHLITNGEILKSLPIIFSRLPLSFAMLVLSRNRMPQAFDDLAKERKLTRITPEELRFSEGEIHHYLEKLGRPVTAQEARAAFLATDGWAMGVNIIAKTGRAQMDGAYDFSQYFATQLWDKWPPELRDFCLKTAIVDEFDPELAAALTGRANAKDVMAHLLRTNSFLSPLHGDTHRYHHLFQAFLRQRLAAENINQSALYRTAANYYKKRKDYTRALRFWLSGGDYHEKDDFLFLFLLENKRSFVADDAEFLRPFFLEGFPETAYRKFPSLHLLAAWYYHLTSRPDEFAVHMDAIIKNLPRGSATNPKFAECGLLAYAVDHRATMPEKIKRFGMFDRFIKAYTPQGLANFMPSFTHNLPFLHRSSFDCAALALQPGSLDKLEKTFARLLGPERAYIKPGIRACFSYERGRLAQALRENSLALAALSETSKIDGRLCLLMMQHSILWQLRQAEQAGAVMAELTALAEGAAQFFMPNLAAYKTKLLLFGGSVQAAREWLEQYFVVEAERIELFRVFRHFTTARAHMALNKHAEAKKHLLMLKAFGKSLARPMDAAEAGVLLAELLWAGGSRAEAAAELESAITILQPYGFLRLIADEGAGILPVLRRVAAAVGEPGYAGAVSREFLSEATLAAHAMAKLHRGVMAGMRPADKPVTLSRQQARMLALLAKGYKNAEIAGLTGLAIPTIKSHTSIAYRKLGVNNAMDAVLKARKLGLIS